MHHEFVELKNWVTRRSFVWPLWVSCFSWFWLVLKLCAYQNCAFAGRGKVPYSAMEWVSSPGCTVHASLQANFLWFSSFCCLRVGVPFAFLISSVFSLCFRPEGETYQRFRAQYILFTVYISKWGVLSPSADFYLSLALLVLVLVL